MLPSADIALRTVRPGSGYIEQAGGPRPIREPGCGSSAPLDEVGPGVTGLRHTGAPPHRARWNGS